MFILSAISTLTITYNYNVNLIAQLSEKLYKNNDEHQHRELILNFI